MSLEEWKRLDFEIELERERDWADFCVDSLRDGLGGRDGREVNREWEGTMFFEKSRIGFEQWRDWIVHQLLPRP